MTTSDSVTTSDRAEPRAEVESPVGTLGIVVGPQGIRRLGWGITSSGESAAAAEQLRDYFTGRRRDFDLPVDLDGVEGSSRSVLMTLWESVGYGETITYGDLAERSGTGVPARAIGSIMGSNPVPMVIPCHRVVAHDGLGGYSGGDTGKGLETKRWLLEHEGALPPMLPF